MRKTLAVLTLLFVGGMSKTASAQQAAEETDECCFLTGAHAAEYDRRQQAILAREALLAAKLAELQGLAATPPVVNVAPPQVTVNFTPPDASLEPHAGWFYMILIAGDVGFGDGTSDTPWSPRLELGLQHVTNSHFGVELSGGVGAWFTRDNAPFASVLRLIGLLSDDNVALLLGPELSVLQAPYNREPWTVVMKAVVGFETHVDDFAFRLTCGPALYSEEPETSGVFCGAGLGWRSSQQTW